MKNPEEVRPPTQMGRPTTRSCRIVLESTIS